MIYTAHYDSPVGKILLEAEDDALVGLRLERHKYYSAPLCGEAEENGDCPMLIRAKNWLDRYFDEERPAIDELRLLPSGSEFARSVWKILCEIPYGTTTTYGEIAERIAKERGMARMSAQAVGGAVGRNPIAIVIPCHRVVGKHGSLTGYGGGIDKKIKLLSHESALKAAFFVPKKYAAP